MSKNRNDLFTVVIKLEKKQIVRINKLFNYKVKVVKYDNNYFNLKILESDLTLLDNSGIEYKIVSYQGLKHFMNLIRKNVTIFIGIIIFTLLLYFNTLTIKEISFSTYTKDNQKIEELIKSNFKSYYGVDILNTDINDINLLLRKEFSHFEWISVEKQGSNLSVNILQPSTINKQVEHIEGFGDLIATKSGVIKFFKVSHGVPLIDENMYVKQGDILVSGNLRIKDLKQGGYYVPATGKVYAEVWETVTIEVSKKQVDSQLSGKLFTEKSLSLFGMELKFKKYDERYTDYEMEEDFNNIKIFNFNIPIGIKESHYLEKDDIINVYNQKTSYDFAYSSIVHDLNRNFDKDDKILEINLITNSEDDDKYTYGFLVKTYEDIAFFQRR
ncbi:MAG: yqfD [Haloplasmataceae bacterium]|jgi:similar to stage IV sporulation protein|nr:yqfD [Haloplasmataceae bacterium]